jgi:hypothetical protein
MSDQAFGCTERTHVLYVDRNGDQQYYKLKADETWLEEYDLINPGARTPYEAAHGLTNMHAVTSPQVGSYTTQPELFSTMDPPGFVNRAVLAGNASASVGAGTTPSGAACTVSECLLENKDRAVCDKCGYVGFDCDNWVGGLGRLCSYCCGEHFAGLR